MTDTSRTLAEVKALLADNTTGDITAQDMRDVVESIANPVPGGGFATWHPTRDWAFSLYAYDGNLSVPSGQRIPVPVDPRLWNGWVADPNDTFGYDYANSKVWVNDLRGVGTKTGDPADPYVGDAGGYFFTGLPRGSVWAFRTYMQFSPWGPPASGYVSLQGWYPLPHMTYPNDFHQDRAGGIWGYPTFAYSSIFTRDAQKMNVNGGIMTDTLTIPLYDDSDMNFPYWDLQGPTIYQTTPDTLTLLVCEIDLWRVG